MFLKTASASFGAVGFLQEIGRINTQIDMKRRSRAYLWPSRDHAGSYWAWQGIGRVCICFLRDDYLLGGSSCLSCVC